VTDRPISTRKPLFSATPRMVVFLIGLYVAWFSAGSIPFAVAYLEAPWAVDLTRDFISAQALARGESLSALDGTRGNAAAIAAGAHPVRIVGQSPFHLHPPPASLPIRLLVPLGHRGAGIVWLGLSVALLGILAHVLTAIVGRWSRSPPLGRVMLFFCLVLWPPALTNFQQGQWSILLATLIAVGFASWDRGSRGRGAAWLAVATAVKLTPAALIPFIASRSRRALVAFLVVLLGAVLLALPFGGGLDAWTAFRRNAGINVVTWQTWWHNTLSINGFVARLFVGGPFAHPLVYAPRVAQAVTLAAAAALTSAALVVTIRRRVTEDRLATEDWLARQGRLAREGCVFALWNILVVVLNPLAWAHYALLLVLPIALVWRACDESSVLKAELRRRLRAATAVALVVLTIPKEALFIVAGPSPTPWALAPVLSAHMFAALLLFTTALIAVWRS
jgi:hypothetical protein